MKEDFNIENYKPQNIYTSSNNFYKEVQENVLRETLVMNERTLSKNNSITPYLKMAIAASVVMLFGVLFIWLSYQNRITDDSIKVVKKEQAIYNPLKKSINVHNNEIQISSDINEKKEKLLTNSLDETKHNDIKNPPEVIKVEEVIIPPEMIICDLPIYKSVMNDNKSKEMSTETIGLDDISDEELAELTQNMENDIYLELYN